MEVPEEECGMPGKTCFLEQLEVGDSTICRTVSRLW